MDYSLHISRMQHSGLSEVSTELKFTTIPHEIHENDSLQVATIQNESYDQWPPLPQQQTSSLHNTTLQWMAQEESLLIRALKAKEKAWGIENPTTLDTAVNLGCLYMNQKRFEEAKLLFMRALHGYKKSESNQHPKVQEVLDLMADLQIRIQAG